MRLRTLTGFALLSIVSAARANEPVQPSTASTESPPRQADAGQSPEPLARRFAQILAEFDSQRSDYRQDAAKAKSQPSGVLAGARRPPDEVAYSRRMLDLAESSPDDPAARDALLWVINMPHRLAIGVYGDQFARAAALLVRHHGDDPEAVRIGLTLDEKHTFPTEALVHGFFASARSRESQGLAKMALAQYLGSKATLIAHARKEQGRPKAIQTTSQNEKVVRMVRELNDERYAYRLHLRQCDPEATRAEAVRLYEEVISDYGDLPYITRQRRERESLLKEPDDPSRTFKSAQLASQLVAYPLTAERRSQLEKALARKRTLGEEAEARLDEMFNLAIGKPAPEIDGVDLAAKPMKLSDHRGKVVVLVFWGTWCGPCMAQVPHERELVARLQGQPFALLGVDCKDDKDTARRVMERERMSWPSWYDGADGEGAIAGRYHIRFYPSVFVLDAKGVIRARDVRGESLDRAVNTLLEEMKPPE
jgi:thiol-disulfide isomerase/thioredoxin